MCKHKCYSRDDSYSAWASTIPLYTRGKTANYLGLLGGRAKHRARSAPCRWPSQNISRLYKPLKIPKSGDVKRSTITLTAVPEITQGRHVKAELKTLLFFKPPQFYLLFSGTLRHNWSWALSLRQKFKASFTTVIPPVFCPTSMFNFRILQTQQVRTNVMVTHYHKWDEGQCNLPARLHGALFSAPRSAGLTNVTYGPLPKRSSLLAAETWR